MSHKSKNLLIIAGPNGAGKTTFVHNIFTEKVKNTNFINADHLAKELYPENVEKVALKAGKIFIQKLDILLEEENDIILETTLSGKNLLKKINKAKEKGFHTKLIFLWISSLELCDFRIKGRIASGGHNIPTHIVLRRYKRGLKNFPFYLKEVDTCDVFLADQTPSLIFSKTLNKEFLL